MSFDSTVSLTDFFSDFNFAENFPLSATSGLIALMTISGFAHSISSSARTESLRRDGRRRLWARLHDHPVSAERAADALLELVQLYFLGAIKAFVNITHLFPLSLCSLLKFLLAWLPAPSWPTPATRRTSGSTRRPRTFCRTFDTARSPRPAFSGRRARNMGRAAACSARALSRPISFLSLFRNGRRSAPRSRLFLSPF